MARDCLGKVTTMLHARFLPSSASKREGRRSAFLAMAILTCIGLQSADTPADGGPELAHPITLVRMAYGID